tara:strand:- start:53833 stop:54633 length:801 start_codon:yes stop_codon:yes gene_type:complete
MLKNKVIVLTGAGGGIGSALAQVLSKAGASLILVGRDQQKLDGINQQLDTKHNILIADIATTEGRQAIAAHCQQLDTGIHMLINNAGIGAFKSFETMDSSEVATMININLSSTILLTQVLLPLLNAQAEAQIINIGSAFGSIGFPGFAVYSASKFGLRGFTEALSRELKDGPVSVRYFAPRATKTLLNDSCVEALNQALKTPVDSPERVADEFLSFLQSKSLRYFVGWPEKLFARINGVFPSLVDSAIGKQLPIIKRCLSKETLES